MKFFGKPLDVRGIHLEQRRLHGADGYSWSLPLCWHAEVLERLGEEQAARDEPWWLSVDHCAIDPADVLTTPDRDVVTCPSCLEWLHS